MEDLIMAALSGNETGVRALLAAGADVNHADDNGWTALGSAAARGHERIVECVLAAAAYVDVHLADAIGRSAPACRAVEDSLPAGAASRRSADPLRHARP